MFGDKISRGPCAWCRQDIPAPQPFAGTYVPIGKLDADGMLEEGGHLEQRGPFHFPACLERFRAARGRILQEHR